MQPQTTTKTKRKTLQQDGISVEGGLYVGRSVLVDEILQMADEGQHVVISAPPGTGKTSSLDLIQAKLEGINELVHYCTPYRNSEQMLSMFGTSWGIPLGDLVALRKVQRCWILVDDAQRGYAEEFDDMWAFLVKDLRKNRDIKVIIAATHDMTSLGSPAAIRLLPHVFRNFSHSEVLDLIEKFCDNFHIPTTTPDWKDYWNAVMELSLIGDGIELQPAKLPEYHIGVVLRFMLDLERMRKVPNLVVPFDGRSALLELRSAQMIQGLDRCFAVDARMIQDSGTRDLLMDVLLGVHSGEIPEQLEPLVRAGVLTTHGTFSCQAACWFYNRIHFPERAQRKPHSLQELITTAVQLLSSSRLQACVQDDKFPLEASFQHLLNETMTAALPTDTSVKPEYRTKASGFLSDTKKGFIDFYVNDKLQWAVELLCLGKGLTEHRARFHPITGKYRELPTKKHLVVDIRGPKEADQSVVTPQQDLCVLYFSSDWATCTIQMETMPDKVVHLRL